MLVVKHMESPENYRQPAEWSLHESCFLAWPCHENLWEENLKPAQLEFAKLCRAIAEGETLQVLVNDKKALADAEVALSGLPIRFHVIPYGDIWLRDTAPIFVRNRAGQIACAKFGFNGWGQKYELPFDNEVSSRIANLSDVPVFSHSWILEGGSIEVDGEGTCLTSKQCLLNPNRNPDLNQHEIEAALKHSLGIQKVLWLTEGLLNDHTDGHIDTIARFVAPHVVACMEAIGLDDPNAEVLESIAEKLSEFTDSSGTRLTVVKIPSPGRVLSQAGEILPASYLNFYIGNSTVVVPTYGSTHDQAAVEAIAKLFPTRKTIGSPAYAILSGGGAFHCITQQVPL